MIRQHFTIFIRIAALCLGMGGVVGLSEYAWADSKEILELPEFVVTGTHISRTDMEGVAPVLVLERKDIERSGAVTLNGLLRDVVFNSAGMIDEQFTQGFAPASAGINLRGLGLSRTLVLVDGRRMPIFPFGQSTIGQGGTDSFVDINLIPLAAVERVEVLKDGASAIYGADAVAGVVNIILRKEYDGVHLSSQYGVTLEVDGEEGQIGAVAGKSWKRTNLTMAVNYLNRSDVKAKDRSISESANGPIDDRSMAGNPGTIIRDLGGPGERPEPDPRCPADQIVGPFCRFDFAPFNTLIPEVERTGVMASFEHQITDAISIFARGMYTHSESDRSLAPASGFFVVGGGNVNNPFPGETVGVIYRLLELGPRVDEFETDAYNALAGLTGTFGVWDLELGFGVGDIETTDTGVSGYATGAAVQGAIDSGVLNPFGNSPAFDPADVEIRTKRKGESRLYLVDFKASGEIIDLPSGPLMVALGGEYRKEHFSDEFDSTTASGGVLGIGGTSAEGTRHVNSAFLEFAVPVLDDLEVQLAGRFDHYSDFGDTFNPKLGLRWQPLRNLVLRGNIGTGFKAPALHELYSGDITGSESVFDPVNNTVVQVNSISSGNPDLDAEESVSYGLGLVWDVTRAWNVSIDYWRIENDDAVISSPQFFVNNETSFPSNVIRNGGGQITSVLSPFQNVAAQKLWGFDLGTHVGLESDLAGDFDLDLQGAYLGSFAQEPAPGQGFEEMAGKDGIPRWRAQSTLSWSKTDYQASVTVNFIDGYERPVADDKIGSWTTVDVQSSWHPNFMGGGTVTFGVDNVFDQEPPEDPFFEGWPFFNRALHNPRGRFLYLRYTHEI